MTEEQRKVLIPLATAHMFQQTTEKDGKTPWEIQENKTNNLLAVLPRDITDSQMFKILEFAKKFELLAFNIGMNHMRDELMEKWTVEKNNLLKVIKDLDTANEKLSNKLGELIGEKE